MQDIDLHHESWALYAIGEHTGRLTWLACPDYNIRLKCDLFVSCVPEELTWGLCFGHSPREWMECSSGAVA